MKSILYLCTTYLQVNLTTCKRFFLDFFTSLLYALFECLLIITSVTNLHKMKNVRKDF